MHGEEGEERGEEEENLPQPPETSPASNYGEKSDGVRGSNSRKSERRREGGDLWIDSKEREDLLIEGPRILRDPRTPNAHGSRRRRRLILGVFFPIFTLFFFFILVG